MILQALTGYYEALLEKGKIDKPGWVKAKISYALDIDADGNLKHIETLTKEENRGKKKVLVPKMMLLPEGEKRSSGIKAQFLWDNGRYVLGLDGGKGNAERALKCFEATKEKCRAVLAEADGPAAVAVKAFFEKWQPEKAAENEILKPYLGDIAGANVTFSVRHRPAAKDAEIIRAWDCFRGKNAAEETGYCSVTGKLSPVARLHPSIKGVRGAQSSGASLVSFNSPAFESYGFEQGANAHVSEYAAFAYTAALNSLLADENHCRLIGDITAVFWTEDADEVSSMCFGQSMFPSADVPSDTDGEEDGQNPDGKKRVLNDKTLKVFMENAALGRPFNFKGVPIDPCNKFYILGLSPNASRLAVSFFISGTLGEFMRNLKKHYDDLEIVRPDYDVRDMLPLQRILYETTNKKANRGTQDKGMAHLAGAVVRSMLTGREYPAALYLKILSRTKSDQDDEEKRTSKVNRVKAAVIKACLSRNYGMKEVAAMALNEECKNVPYRLGRLFAVLECIQEDSSEVKLNSTIKDRYFNAACSRPAVVFPMLVRLSNHHMDKLKEESYKTRFNKLISRIIDGIGMEDGIEALPAHLDSQGQGAFILGYYHQRQKLFEKKEA